jgi:hypothetical protein
LSITLGQLVRDKVSGFTGVAIAQHNYLQGCSRFSVQPKVNEKGELPKYEAFDEPQLEVIEEAKIEKTAADNSGGPATYLPSERIGDTRT